jgi:hypothetical protein
LNVEILIDETSAFEAAVDKQATLAFLVKSSSKIKNRHSKID